jgi:hypothetical protein
MLRFIQANPVDHDINGQWAAVMRISDETSKVRQAPTHVMKFKT